MGSQGLGVNKNVSFTVNAVDVHAICKVNKEDEECLKK